MHFSLVLIDHPQQGVMRAFDDVVLPLSFAFRRLGWEAEILRQRVNAASRNILFGTANDPSLTGLDPPRDSIVFNLEQLSAANSAWGGPAYLDHLRKFTIWDYSRRNLEFLAARDIPGVLLPPGYVPEMTRLRRDRPAGSGILFYGHASPRRQALLNKLQKSGLEIKQPPAGTFGRDRDLAIAGCRLYLNIHHYQPATLEVVRLGYLWANHCPVVSERRPDTEVQPGLETACAYADYDRLVETVREYSADDRKLKALGEAGFEAFSALSLEKSLAELVGRRVVHGLGADLKEPRPKHLNVGSGRDFRNGALNVDISDHCRPDLVLDMSRPLEDGRKYRTERFGDIEMPPGSFEKITAFEVLEHVADLPQTMRNFLELLEDGGRLIVSVPYDLSLGAWQDPTHRRAFNENSWLYYTTWFWYLGWTEARFEEEEVLFILSPLGTRLARRGADSRRLAQTPRAVEGMRVTLRKRRLTAEEKKIGDNVFRTVYPRPVIDWRAAGDDDSPLEKLRPATRAQWRRGRAELAAATWHYYLYKVLGLFGFGRDRRGRLKQRRQQLRRRLEITPGAVPARPKNTK